MKLIFEDEDTTSTPVDNADSDDNASRSSKSSPVKTATLTPVIPKLSRLVGSVTSGIAVSYYGALDFLDNQQQFDFTFGMNPLILSASPTSHQSSDVSTCVRLYADKCMLDIFLEIYRKDYVGGYEAGPKRKLVHEICKRIVLLHQE